MATRRMLSQAVIEQGFFTGLTAGAQCIYMHVNMATDDEGFFTDMRTAIFKSNVQGGQEAEKKALSELLDKSYLLDLGDGVYVVKHFFQMNTPRRDRFTRTIFTEKERLLYVKPDGSYTLKKAKGQPLQGWLSGKLSKPVPAGDQ